MPKESMYEVNQPIEFTYRCNGDPATANPVVDVINPSGVVSMTLTVGGIPPDDLSQIGVTRLFKGVFTPDVVGVWTAHGTDSNGGDQAKDFSVGTIGVQSIATAVLALDGKIDGVSNKVDGLIADSGGAHFG